MKRKKWIIWTIIIVLAGVGVWYWKFRKEEVPVVLETEQPHYGAIATSVTATGSIQPVDTVQVGTQVSGTISKVYTDFNETVKAGQLIAELDKVLLLSQVQQANAALQTAQSNVAFQESNFNRQKQLLDVGAISKADYETAQNSYSVAKASVSNASAQVKSAQRNLSFANIYSPINGTVLSRNVSVGQTVASSLNTPTLFVIARDLTKMQVQAAVDEADIGNVKAGQRVTFTVDAFPDDVFEGSVNEVRLRPAVSSNVVTYVTLVDASNGNMKLKPGMTASITIYTKEAENAMLISAKALKFRPDSVLMEKYKIESGRDMQQQQKKDGPMPIGAEGKPGQSGTGRTGRKGGGFSKPDTLSNGIVAKRAFVWVKKDSTLTRKMIQTGLTDNTNVQVLSGLNADDVVVTGMLQGEVAKQSGAARSPFMPQRRGGGQGGGGNRGGGGAGGGGGQGGGGGSRPR